MAQTAQDILNAINGVTFGQGSLANADISGFSTDKNAAGGGTDVYSDVTNAATGYVKVAYVDSFVGKNDLSSHYGLPVGSAGSVTSVHYAYTQASGDNFATFGYITLSNQNNAGPAIKYYVHGFSQNGILLSHSATLSVDEVNGLAGLSDATTFEILSTKDLGLGPSSPMAQIQTVADVTNGTAPNGYYYNRYLLRKGASVVDGAGISHYSGYKYFYKTYHGNNYGGPHTTKLTNYTFDGNPDSSTFPLIFTNDASTFDITSVQCYAEGTCILTARGEVPVEELVEGDEAITASGRTRPVIWIGSRRVRPAAHPRPEQLNPVRVRRGAFGDNQPVRDLLLSPGHAVFMQGVLVPVGKLVNGATIVQDQVEAVRYFHVELDAHDILLAEGLACESYLDDGNRTAFANADQTADLDPRLDTQDFEHACAPLVRDGEALTRLRTALHARAQALGWRAAADPALEIVVDGVALPPLHQGAGRAWFHLPAAAAVTIRSRAGRPSEVLPEGQDPARHDPRRLGVALCELRLDGQPLDLADPAAFGPGFHALETHHHAQWRWTNGSAQLNLTLQAPAMLELTIRDAAPAWTRPAPRLVKAS